MSYEVSMGGIRAALMRLNVAANDVANLNTEGHTNHRVVNTERPDGGVEAHVEKTDEPVRLEEEISEQIIATHEMKANAVMLRAQSEADQTIIDLIA